MTGYKQEPATNRTDLCLPSRLESATEVRGHLDAMLKQFDYTGSDAFGIRLSLEEAVVNAIRHGNGMDFRKNVRVALRVSRDEVWISVEDEGVGFTPEVVPDPTSPENLERPHGRGLMLMRHFMTSVEYSDSGNRVELCKHRAQPASSITPARTC
ncbi:MAG: ATP-binding protein [Rhodopirellula sp.]|nr:ATP-binding protein [Rhodopirellula sp.]